MCLGYALGLAFGVGLRAERVPRAKPEFVWLFPAGFRRGKASRLKSGGKPVQA
jgi:hypothetical protein